MLGEIRPTHSRLAVFGIYLVVVLGFGLFIYDFLSGDRLNTTADGGLILYTIIKNIQRVLEGEWSGWTNQLIFYPNQHTSAYTDHFYLHSTIGLPFYAFTNDPLNTYDFIFVFQLVVAATGYFLLAMRITNYLPAIIVSGLFFLYLQAFVQTHPQISVYGFLPWFVHWTLRYTEAGSVRFIYGAAVAFLAQALVGIYLQLFILTFGFCFLILILADLIQRKKWKPIISRKNIVHLAIALLICGGVLYAVNRPYLEFKQEEGIVRSVGQLDYYYTDLIRTFFVPTRNYDLHHWLWSSFVEPEAQAGDATSESRSFLGFTGIWILILTPLLILKSKPGPQRKAVLLSFIFLVLMWLFSLGPHIFVNGTNTGIKGPYFYLYHASFIFQSIRVTGRIIVFMALPISLLVAGFWNRIAESNLQHAIKILVLSLISVLVVLDVFQIRKGFNNRESHDAIYVYEHVNRTPGLVLLELPSEFSCRNLPGACAHAEEGYYMFTHIYHRKWTVNGRSGIRRSNSEGIIRRVDKNFDHAGVLSDTFSRNHISNILVHRKRIAPAAQNNFLTFIKKTLETHDIPFMDDHYVLLTQRAGPISAQEIRSKRELFDADWKQTQSD